MNDALGRPLRDLRISVTDRCNLRCRYCMPAEIFGPDHAFLHPKALLSFDQIEAVARAGASLGVRKLRLTGGEPLLRPHLPDLVARLARIEGIEEVALTSNGLLLPRQARALRAAGLARVTVSLDSLCPSTFGAMNGLGVPPEKVIAGIEAALAAGLGVKINTVVQRGRNDDDLADFWRKIRHLGSVRFIEYMDVGASNTWNMAEVLPSAEVRARLEEDFSPLPPKTEGEVATRFLSESGHEVGFISSVTEPFCGGCTRLRLSAVGALYTCLFATEGHDLRPLLNETVNPKRIAEAIAAIWQQRNDRYSEQRSENSTKDRRGRLEMSFIGG